MCFAKRKLKKKLEKSENDLWMVEKQVWNWTEATVCWFDMLDTNCIAWYVWGYEVAICMLLAVVTERQNAAGRVSVLIHFSKQKRWNICSCAVKCTGSHIVQFVTIKKLLLFWSQNSKNTFHISKKLQMRHLTAKQLELTSCYIRECCKFHS